MLVLYGSQTGYAFETAERIVREAKRRHFETRIMPMDDYDVNQLPLENLIVFVCSVTGQGEPPDNMKKMWKFLLRKELPSDGLSNVHFGVFGQGDSSYPKFNTPAKKLWKRLVQLGGSPILPVGNGDDQHYLGVDGALDPWLEEFWKRALELFPLKPGMEIIPENILPTARFRISFLENTEFLQLEMNLPNLNSMYSATVKENRKITPSDHFQDVRHIVLDTSAPYNPGDVFVVMPKNCPLKVQDAINLFHWNDIADKPISISHNSNNDTMPADLPKKTTIRWLLENYLDLWGRPKRYFFQLLSYFATEEQQKEKLKEFSSTLGQDELYAYCHRMRRTYYEVLADFSSVRVPLQYLLDLIPPLKTRSFSISSSPLKHPGEIHLTVAIVNYKTKMKEPRVGVCTQWIKTWTREQRIGFCIKRGTLRPSPLDAPIICIGPGTGVAPMRSIIWDRIAQGANDQFLFFGNRYHEKDFLYHDEWELLQKQEKLILSTAFSRDQPEKIYVQDRILQNSTKICEWILEKNATIYLSGNAKNMPLAVEQALIECLSSKIPDASSYFTRMKRLERFQQEVW